MEKSESVKTQVAYYILLLLVVLSLCSCRSSKEEIELTFQVDLSDAIDKMEKPISVGIIGNAPFLDRFESTPMEKRDEGIYEKTFSIPDSLAGQRIRYKFVANTAVENERYGWRWDAIPSESKVLPTAQFNHLKGSTGTRIEPSPPIPVIWADSEQESEYFESPFFGITTDGEHRKDLFPIESTGVSTKPIQTAVKTFLAALTEKQKDACTFKIEDDEWRRWHNIEIYDREGIALFEMDSLQRNLAFNILNESLSAKGVRKARDIMAMEEYLKELVIQAGNRDTEVIDRLGHDKYYFTFMGEPSDTEPWGWQIDGHHLVINYFVLGDQIVMTPTFMGSEPNHIKEGQNKGLRTFEEEESKGLNFYRTLDDTQKELATLWTEKEYNFSQAEAFRDNETIPYSGISTKDLRESQSAALLSLIEEYIGRMRPGHSEIKMEEIQSHMEETWFCWVGGSSDKDPFYYRIQSPVIMIEFDHHEPVFLKDRNEASDGPVKWHVHTVVRTPNGNDYGKDLLRQHLERHHH